MQRHPIFADRSRLRPREFRPPHTASRTAPGRIFKSAATPADDNGRREIGYADPSIAYPTANGRDPRLPSRFSRSPASRRERDPGRIRLSSRVLGASPNTRARALTHTYKRVLDRLKSPRIPFEAMEQRVPCTPGYVQEDFLHGLAAILSRRLTTHRRAKIFYYLAETRSRSTPPYFSISGAGCLLSYPRLVSITFTFIVPNRSRNDRIFARYSSSRTVSDLSSLPRPPYERLDIAIKHSLPTAACILRIPKRRAAKRRKYLSTLAYIFIRTVPGLFSLLSASRVSS